MTTEQESKPEFNIGDVVQLNSGGPGMTVTGLGTDGGLWVMWLVSGEARELRHPLPPATVHHTGARPLGTAPQEDGTERFTDIVFDSPPGPVGGRFVEVEDETGHSVVFGEWVRRQDGYWVLRIRPQKCSARLAEVCSALAPFAALELHDNPQCDTYPYSIRSADITAARAAIKVQDDGS